MTGGVLKIARRTWEVGVAVTGRRRGGAFSTLPWRPGLRASSDGVLATKSETQNVSEYMLLLALCLVTFCVSRRRRNMYCGQARLCICVCLSVRGRTPTLLHGPGCNSGGVVEAAP